MTFAPHPDPLPKKEGGGQDGEERRCNVLADEPAAARDLWEQSLDWVKPFRA